MIGALFVAMGLVLASPPTHVMDQADVFGAAGEAELERKLVNFESQHRIEIVVATFESLGGRPEHAVNLQLIRDWALGSRTSKRAVLISYWTKDRATRIDMSDALPQFSSGKAAEIVDTQMIPLFKQGRSVMALEAGADGVMAFLGANPWSATPIVKRTSGGPAGKALGGLGSVALVVVFLFMRIGLASAGLGGRGYRRGWGSSSWRGSSWGGSSRSSWGGGGGSRSSGGGGGGFSGRGASGRW